MLRDIWLVVWHDRHTDDHYEAFFDIDLAKEYCRKLADKYPPSRYQFVEKKNMGAEYCLYCSDDYCIGVYPVTLNTNRSAA